MATRQETAVHETNVRHVAQPLKGENGPHLSDLREFVDACDGLPNDLLVRIDQGHLSESGSRNVTFRVSRRVVAGS